MKELLLPSIVTGFIEKSTGECLKGQQWEAAYNSNEFSTAFTQAENEISKNPHNLDAKLWWTICGIKTGSLPLNAISSPLSELIHEANCNQRL